MAEMPPSSSCQADCACSCPAGAEPEAQAGQFPSRETVWRTEFSLPGMDCPAEEQQVRWALAGAPVMAMTFDLPGRRLVVHHAGSAEAILARLTPLGYRAALMATQPAEGAGADEVSQGSAEARVLWGLLAANAVMFVVEIGAGWWAKSAGLMADAMDMFADAAVYGVALYAVGRSAAHQLTAARLSGVFQLLLGLGALAQVGQRVIAGEAPAATVMVGISVLALLTNIGCLLLIARHRHRGAHMKASYIFSANDVLANFGVIVSGALVGWLGVPWPDWIIGAMIAVMVLVGAWRILRLR